MSKLPSRFHFRAWIPSLNRLVYETRLDGPEGEVIKIIVRGDGPSLVSIAQVGPEYRDNGEELFTFDDGRALLMQSTGHCDSDGREIFESDIARVGYIEDGEERFSVELVEWDSFNAGFGLLGADRDIRTGCRVIGNDFENRELLK